MRIIVTDLTRFNRGEKVCMAGVCPETNICVRPMPYINKSSCRKFNILPGAILESNFIPDAGCRLPHSEDHKHTEIIRPLGPCSSGQFLSILENSCYPCVQDAFGDCVGNGSKCVPVGKESDVSLATIEINPEDISIVEDSFNPEKLKIIFTDRDGMEFRYLSITDLGFHEHVQELRRASRLDEINDFISRQERVFLRLGLSRVFQPKNNPNKGYWLQVNGIYTFPECIEGIRCYNE